MKTLQLQILWLSTSIGISINQKTKTGSLPITPYYFWPVSEAWEQLRFELDSKSWIRGNEQIELLNISVEVMNQWQEEGLANIQVSLQHKELIVFLDNGSDKKKRVLQLNGIT
jgi:30S ribosomal protein 3